MLLSNLIFNFSWMIETYRSNEITMKIISTKLLRVAIKKYSDAFFDVSFVRLGFKSTTLN